MCRGWALVSCSCCVLPQQYVILHRAARQRSKCVWKEVGRDRAASKTAHRTDKWTHTWKRLLRIKTAAQGGGKNLPPTQTPHKGVWWKPKPHLSPHLKPWQTGGNTTHGSRTPENTWIKERERPHNDSEIQKEGKKRLKHMLVLKQRRTRTHIYTQTWMNMAHWDLKYVWYVYYASTNTGAERGRKQGDWRKEGKESNRDSSVCFP